MSLAAGVRAVAAEPFVGAQGARAGEVFGAGTDQRADLRGAFIAATASLESGTSGVPWLRCAGGMKGWFQGFTVS